MPWGSRLNKANARSNGVHEYRRVRRHAIASTSASLRSMPMQL